MASRAPRIPNSSTPTSTLASTAGGVLQVICRDVYDTNLGLLKDEPSVGADEVPISQVQHEEAAGAATAVAEGDIEDLPTEPELTTSTLGPPVPPAGPTGAPEPIVGS